MAEVDVQRRITQAFINTQPVSLVLTPQVKSRTSIGGYTLAPGTPKPAQTLRLVEPGDSGGREPIRAADGLQRRIEYILLGMFDADIAVNDTFTHAGDEWIVVEKMHDNGWEQRGLVARYVTH